MRAGPRLGVLAGTYLLLITLGGVASVVLLTTWDTAATRRRTMLIEAEQLARLQTAYLEQETAVRGFVITGQAAFLEPWESGTRDAERLRSLLRLPAEHDDRLAAAWVAVGSAADEWRQVAAAVVETRQHADVTGTAPGIDARIDDGKRLFDVLRGRFDAFAGVVAREVATADAATRRAQRLSIGVVAGVFAAALAVTVLSGYLIRRWLTQPLAAIVRSTRELRDGQPAVFPSGGLPDIREVVTAVDGMQRAISEQRDVAIRSREAMEQSAVLAVQLRSELAHELGSYPSGWTVAAGLVPATGVVAGDSYDVSLINVHTMGIIMLDIAGHGAPAAIAALRCKEILKAGLRSGMEPGATLNFLMASDHGLEDSFLTAVVALLDTDTGLCRYASAGHPPPMIIPHNGEPIALPPTGPLLGPIPATWKTETVHVPNESKFVIYTDGLIEARNVDHAFFGERGIIDVVAETSCETTHAVVKNLLERVLEFNEGRVADDVTIIVACRLDESEDYEP